MSQLKCLWLAAVLFIAVRGARAAESDDALRLVDPFVGTSIWGGAMYPGAALPFSMVKLSPDTTGPSSAGYNPSEPILGFSHTHIGGTGGSAFHGQIRVRPQSGALVVNPAASPKEHEIASPGYYAVDLMAEQVRVELTALERAGVHRYTFPAGRPARVLIDLAAIINNSRGDKPAGVCTGSVAKFTSNRAVEGSTNIRAGTANLTYAVYFAAEFDSPAVARGTWLEKNARPDTTDVTGGEGQQAGVYAEFAPGKIVELKVGISFTSIDVARINLKAALGLTFDQVRARAEGIWRDHLAKINVEGGTEAQRRQFYTALYHTVLAPTDVTGDNGDWAADPKQPIYYDIHTIWDTFRSTDPLRILICPEREQAIIRSLLAVYQKTGWLPDAWVFNRRSIPFQGGTDADNVIADAMVKHLNGFDTNLAWDAVKKDATAVFTGYLEKTFPGRGKLPPYLEKGYVPSAVYAGKNAKGESNEWSSAVSRTLEYAYNDFCAAQVAGVLGHTEEAKMLRERSLNSYKLFRPDWKLFWGKTADGQWVPDADGKHATFGWTNAFYEGSAWQYRFSVPHDVAGLIERVGGDAAFVRVLDQYFDENLHWAGNEPGFLTPWLYIYAGQPGKATDRVRAILGKDFKVAAGGYPGDEDVGAMSAWYIFASIGLFPNAGQDVYLLGSPLFSKTTLKLGASGKILVIQANGLSSTNRYVQSATLNGKPLDRAWLRHDEIIGGAKLDFTMGPQPFAWGVANRPPSLSTAAAKQTEAAEKQ